MRIKVCGLKNYENITNVISAGADYIGFIFHKASPRYFNDALSLDQARSLNAKKVGVFVNESVSTILDKVKHYDLDYVQLHGNESPEYCNELMPYVKVIKAFGIDKVFDFEQLKSYKVNHFLFDTKTERYGGSGKTFNHRILKEYKLDTTFFLSGGISESNIETIKQLNLKHLYGVDLNSKFETCPGIKEAYRIKQFIKQLK